MSKIFFFSLLLMFICSCSTDNTEPLDFTCDENLLETASYELNVKQIIDNSCAFSGCHIIGSSAPGNYSMYDGILGDLENGKFEIEVFEFQTMPLLSDPNSNKLTNSEIELLQCWYDNGYPEN